MNPQGIKDYVLARAQETSTWRGLVLLIAAAGAHLSAEISELIITIGIGLSGLIGAAFPDAKKD